MKFFVWKLSRILAAVVTFEVLTLGLAALGLCFITEHALALVGVGVSFHSPVSFHAIDTATHLARR